MKFNLFCRPEDAETRKHLSESVTAEFGTASLPWATVSAHNKVKKHADKHEAPSNSFQEQFN